MSNVNYWGVLPDKQIRQLAEARRMIDPFVEAQKRGGVISYGLSSYGYDVRVADEFLVFTPQPTLSMVDPKHFDASLMTRCTGDCVIPPNSFALAKTVERFKIPRDIMCIVTGKSTYARAGIIVNVTPLEPEWEGVVTLEISNTSTLPAKIYANEGIAQVIFLQCTGECEISYADKKGKYQGQDGIVPPKV